jgi:hypothetical protein
MPAGLAESQDVELIRREVGEGVGGGIGHGARLSAYAVSKPDPGHDLHGFGFFLHPGTIRRAIFFLRRRAPVAPDPSAGLRACNARLRRQRPGASSRRQACRRDEGLLSAIMCSAQLCVAGGRDRAYLPPTTRASGVIATLHNYRALRNNIKASGAWNRGICESGSWSFARGQYW